ncbi:amidohydrolase family protein [Streptomyces hainanensis]|uniref:Amidohydrolase n=1 Tax=Streptomyces hainanensis TaxID=402648 RepID=A0A4R4TD37_9ACTN|nr:amidohydrolase family protein [Streptomyces hainanensis]TDC72753.1 amidohydrolase [Streptomyces hainanensis]
MERLLIRRALLIDTDPAAVALPSHDLLVEDGRVAAVGQDLPAHDAAEVIDGTGLIVLPGFVDAHRHVWQAALRGIATDVDLDGYLRLVLGEIAPRYRPSDVHVGTLAGALECLASGITTVQDHSHVLFTPDHAEAAILALRGSGIRAVLALGQPVFGDGLTADQIRRVHRDHFAPAPDDLITLALGPLGPSYSPMEDVTDSFALAAELGLRVFSHVASGPVAELPVAALRSAGLLGPNITFAHGNSLPDEELALIAEAGAAMAVCPAVEARMGFGPPLADRLRRHGVTAGLGVDVVSATAGDMFSLMRAMLTSGGLSPADVLRHATAGGAAALGLADRVGSLAPGAAADLVFLRATDTNLLGGHHDPVATVVTAAHPGNIQAVLIAGQRVPLETPPDLPAALAASAAHVTAG